MSFRTILISIILLYSIQMNCTGQNDAIQDNHLRAVIILVDTVALNHQLKDGKVETMYKFEVTQLFYGIYEQKYVYITTYPDETDIYQFNRKKNSKDPYYWVLIKTGEEYKNIPIYRHSGNF